MELREAEFIRLDLFPAIVIASFEGDEDYLVPDEVRVIITNDTFYAFIDGEFGPEILYEVYLSDFTGSNKEGYTVSDEVNSFYIKRATTCGCGSRLRGFLPYPGVRQIINR